MYYGTKQSSCILIWNKYMDTIQILYEETKVEVISVIFSQTHAVLTKPCDATSLLDNIQRPAWMGVPWQRSKKLFFLTRHLNLLMMPPISNSLHQKFPYLHIQMCKINHVLWKRGCPALQLCNWGILIPSKHRRPQLFLKILWTRTGGRYNINPQMMLLTPRFTHCEGGEARQLKRSRVGIPAML